MLKPDLTRQIITEANAAGIDPAALLSVLEVESNGRFFARVRGKTEPLIRFEGHYFDRRLDEATRVVARAAGLSSPIAGKIPNPGSQEQRWDMLDRACSLSPNAALESTSWGVGQVMGAHWKTLGYPSVEAFVIEARSGAPGQIKLLARFIDKNGLVAVLNARDWATFARRYNGPVYRQNAYDTKLAKAYARHKLAAPDDTNAPIKESDTLASGVTGDAVRDLQLMLNALGFSVQATGLFDEMTKAAVIRFQTHSGLVPDGIVGAKTLAALEACYRTDQTKSGWLARIERCFSSIFGLRHA